MRTVGTYDFTQNSLSKILRKSNVRLSSEHARSKMFVTLFSKNLKT